MTKINVLHIIKSLGRGGAEMLLPETLKLHDKDKFEFHYIYFLPWKNQLSSLIENEGGVVKCFPASNNILLISKYRDVVKYCQKFNIQLIHCHLPWAGFLGRLVYFKTGIPTIYTEHNMQERYHVITKHINKLTFNYQSLALGVSDDVSNSIRKNINPSIKVNTLLNGVNTDSFNKNYSSGLKIREKFGIPTNSIVIGNIAVFRFQKRLVEWLQVFKEIEDKNPQVFGIIVGAGPLETEIKAELNRLNLQHKVFLPGLITEVKPYLSAMDIFMMSSSFEGLPIALLEAMSMECAIVSTDAGGIKEVIRNDEDGLICDVNNVHVLKSLVQNLIDNPQVLNNFKARARLRVVTTFSLKLMVANLEKIYTKFYNI